MELVKPFCKQFSKMYQKPAGSIFLFQTKPLLQFFPKKTTNDINKDLCQDIHHILLNIWKKMFNHGSC